jgi:glycosyltransferase involved in cell wall biosynthesis
MNPPVYFDERWQGNHGIGRVANEIMKGMEVIPLRMKGKPVSILDPIRFWVKTMQIPINAIIFSPGFNAPIFCKQNFYFIVHDLNHIDRPENTNFLKKIYYNLILKRACRFAKKVFTVSEFSKSRILDWTKVSNDKVVNIGNGVDISFNPNGEKYPLAFEYFLCVSNRKLHKNELRILQAFAKADLNKKIKLVFTGMENEDLTNEINKLGIRERIHFTGRLAEQDLPKIYRGAIALLFPSLYEGFGLPVLEAMASGIPVLSSNSTSLKEISGDAAILVNPESVDEIQDGIEKLFQDANLRKNLVEKGFKLAHQYQWEFVIQKIKQEISNQR